MQDIEKR